MADDADQVFPPDSNLVGALFKSRKSMLPPLITWLKTPSFHRELKRLGGIAESQIPSALTYMQPPDKVGKRSSDRPCADLVDADSKLKYFVLMKGDPGYHSKVRMCESQEVESGYANVALWVVSRAVVVKRIRQGLEPLQINESRVPEKGKTLRFKQSRRSAIMSESKHHSLHGLNLNQAEVKEVICSGRDKAVSFVILKFKQRMA